MRRHGKKATRSLWRSKRYMDIAMSVDAPRKSNWIVGFERKFGKRGCYVSCAARTSAFCQTDWFPARSVASPHLCLSSQRRNDKLFRKGRASSCSLTDPRTHLVVLLLASHILPLFRFICIGLPSSMTKTRHSKLSSIGFNCQKIRTGLSLILIQHPKMRISV